MNSFVHFTILNLCVFTIHSVKITRSGQVQTSSNSVVLPKDRSNYDTYTRIFDRQEATPHAYPYQVAIQATSYGGTKYFCSGSLVARDMVLTAGHCVEGIQVAILAFGVHNLNSANEGAQVLKSTEFILHEFYDIKIFTNDIALIELPTKVLLNRNVKTIVLDDSEYLTETYTGDTVLISGWGITRGRKRAVAVKLNYLENEVISNDDCKKSFGVAGINIRESHICVSNRKANGICSEDSGGPMVYNSTLIGISSFGPEDCQSELLPSGYTRISTYKKWIERNCPNCKFSAAENLQFRAPLYIVLGFCLIKNLILSDTDVKLK